MLILTYPAAPPPGDTVPDPIAFDSNVSDATLNTLYQSSIETLTGFNLPTGGTISGGQWSQNGGAFTSAPLTWNPNDTVQVQGLSSGAYTTETTIAINIGGVLAEFKITTQLSPGGETPPAGWVDHPILNFMGRAVNLTTEQGINGTFSSFNAKRTSMRYNNFTYPLAGYADYGWGLQQICDFLRGGPVDWRNDGFAFVDSMRSTYAASGWWRGEHTWLMLDFAASVQLGAPNAAQHLAALLIMVDEAEHWRVAEGGALWPSDASYYNMRVVTRSLQAWLAFKWVGTASSTSRNWPAINQATATARLQEGLAKLAASQQVNGDWNKGWNTPGVTHWYHGALALWTLIIAAHNGYIDEPTLVSVVRKYCDGYWACRWQQGGNGSSISFYSAYHVDDDWRGPNPDLDGCFVTLHYWLAKKVADNTYLTRGDLLLENGNNLAWLDAVSLDARRKNYDYLFAMGGITHGYHRADALQTTQALGRPKNTGLPVVSNIGGSIFQCTDGVWTNSPSGFTRRWLRGVLANAPGGGIFIIPGATGQTFDRSTVTADRIWCEVSAVKAGHTGVNAPVPAVANWVTV